MFFRIELPGQQEQLVTTLKHAIGDTPLIAILVHGGTLALTPIVDQLDAIVDAWYPGMQGGHAVAGWSVQEIFSLFCQPTVSRNFSQLPEILQAFNF